VLQRDQWEGQARTERGARGQYGADDSGARPPNERPRLRAAVAQSRAADDQRTSVQQKLNGELNQGLVAADGGVEADLEVDPALEISTRAGAGAAVPVITCG
jgi:hypothetical protein